MNQSFAQREIFLEKMLIIDDEPGVLNMICGHFQLRGFEVITAGDGKNGIEACEKYLPDIILLDLKMKHTDGDRAVPELKRLNPNAKIFVVSAYQYEMVQRRIMNLNVDAYFEKPVSILELEKKV